MFVQAERGNCQLLKRCVQPLLNGSQLQVILGCVSQLFIIRKKITVDIYRCNKLTFFSENG